MSDSPFSNAWYRVSQLKPRLARHATISRHRYRGESWYVARDLGSGRVHRFTPATYLLIAQMDGLRTLQEIWSFALERLADDAPSQDELIQLIGQLHASDLLQFDVTPDTAELLDRHAKTERSRTLQRFASPLFMRFPLWDPDRFILALLPRLKWMWHWQGAVLWLLLVVPAVGLAALHWDALTSNLSDRVLATGNLVTLWLLFPLVKLLHELGHGFATRSRGGEVHEIGLMLLVFTPVPYVDSSSANAFRSKYDRALVGAAGMLVETGLAALAMYAWVLLQPGLARAVCFNIMLIAGFSTLIFNLNPLLRYDGYFMLCDLIEMPNLARRSQQFWVGLIDRHLFRSDRVAPQRVVPGEQRWLVGYTPLSSAYRLLVMLTIAMLIATRFFVVGVILALWSVALSVVWPIAKGLWHVFDSPVLAAQRTRAIALTAGALCVAALLLGVVPAPHRKVVEGVVWVPDDAQLRAQNDGFVRELLVAPGTLVSAGADITLTEDPVRTAELKTSAARLAESRAKWLSLNFTDRAQAELARRSLDADQAAWERAATQVLEQRVSARTGGTVIVPRANDLPGRYVRKGELIGYIAQGEHRSIRIVVGQADVDRVREQLRAVQVRVAPALNTVLQARLVREVPGGNQTLPSRALSIEGGGEIALDPTDPDGRRALNRFFEFDVELVGPLPRMHFGARAYVRLVFDPLPLGWQLAQAVRQLFLARFDV